MSSSFYKENDNYYLNIPITHSDITSKSIKNIIPAVGPPYSITVPNGTEPVIMKYDVTKTIPLLDKARDYYCSVIRFDIPLNEIPLFIMPIIPSQSNSDLTPFIIGIKYNNIYYPENLIYLPENDLVAPTQNNNSQVITPYYFAYSYEVLIRMLNLSLQSVYTLSGVKALVDATYGSTMMTPYFFYNPATQLISLVVNKYFTNFGAGYLPSLPQIFINTSLQNYLDGFPFSHTTDPNAISFGSEYYFLLQSPTGIISNNFSYLPYQYNQPIGVPPPIADYFQFAQQFVSVNYWNSLRKILITSTSLPINKEYEPALNNSGVNVSLPVLTDFVPSIEKPGDTRSIAYYNPSGQYRLIDLISDQPIYKVDINIYWQDLYGNYYPLSLSFGQQANIKIGFFRKSLYKQNNFLLKS